MGKRVFGLLLCLLCLLMDVTAVQATILPASGMEEGFLAWTGMEAVPAVVLCESLDVYDARGDQGGVIIEQLQYTGTETIPVLESWDGWARVYYGASVPVGEEVPTGWVESIYLMIDPAWYICDGQTQVYAYPDGMSPRVALLPGGTRLPILMDCRDGQSVSGWVCVSLDGGAGWIRKTPKDTVSETWFRPLMLENMTAAVLTYRDEAISISSLEDMAALSALLTSVNDLGAEISGCPFDATLDLHLADGTVITLALATDSCCVYRVDGRDYQYARSLIVEPDSGVDNTVLLERFGVETWDEVLLPGNG